MHLPCGNEAVCITSDTMVAFSVPFTWCLLWYFAQLIQIIVGVYVNNDSNALHTIRWFEFVYGFCVLLKISLIKSRICSAFFFFYELFRHVFFIYYFGHSNCIVDRLKGNQKFNILLHQLWFNRFLFILYDDEYSFAPVVACRLHFFLLYKTICA